MKHTNVNLDTDFIILKLRVRQGRHGKFYNINWIIAKYSTEVYLKLNVWISDIYISWPWLLFTPMC